MQGEFASRLIVVERGLNLLDLDALGVSQRAVRLQQQIREAKSILGGAAGLITVTVKNASSGAVISGATVTATDGVFTIFTGTTDGSGQVRIPIYSTDALNVTASATGFASNTVPITPVLDDSNTLTINLTGIFGCGGCSIPESSSFTLTFTYWTNFAKTTFNSTTASISWDSAHTQFDIGGSDSTITLTDYFVLSGGSTTHRFRILCSGGSIVVDHHFSAGAGEAIYGGGVPNNSLSVTCTPFDTNAPASTAYKNADGSSSSDRSIDIS